MKIKSRLLASILLMAMLAAVGCGGGGAASGDTTAAGGDTTTAPETEDIYKNVPTADYGGYEFRIYSSTCDWALYKLDSEGMNGEVLNDAVFERNRAVEERLNINFVFTEKDSMYSSHNNVKKVIMAGDDAYDVTYLSTCMAAPISVDNLFVDLYTVDAINLEEPWWNKLSIPYYELEDKLFWAHGDASIHYYDCMWSLFFNKQLIDELKLDDPYKMVADKTWTIDKFHSMIQAAGRDLDGNGTMDDTDQFGLTTHSGSTLGFLHGMNERAIDIKDGVPFVVKPTERMFDVMEKIQKVFTDKNIRTKNDEVTKACFSDGNALFLIETLGNASWLREMNADFGIVPFPMYDAKQDGFHSYISPGSMSVQIPVTVADVERTGTVVEVMNALSYETVRPAYLEVVLGVKYMRDDVSKSTMEMMLSTAECELAYVYQWAGYHNTFLNGLSTDTAMASAIDGQIASVEAAINSFMEKLK